MDLTTKRGVGLVVAGALGLLLAMIVGMFSEGIEREQYAGPGVGETATIVVTLVLFLGGLLAALIGLGVVAWNLLRR